MIIENAGHKYRVLQKEVADEQRTIYQCIGVSENEQFCKDGQVDEYTIIKFDMSGCSESLITYLTKLHITNLWKDFSECFQYENSFYLIFSYAGESLLIEQIRNEEPELLERLKIGEKLMEKMIVLNLPQVFLLDGLEKEHVTISRDLEINFRYDCAYVKNYHSIQIKDICKSIAFWMDQLFHQEIKDKICEKLNKFYNELQQGEFENYMKMYEAYMDMNSEFLLLAENKEALQPKSFLFKSWEWIKYFTGKTLDIWSGLLFISCVGIAFYFMFMRERSVPEGEMIQYIGTVEIEQGGDIDEVSE